MSSHLSTERVFTPTISEIFDIWSKIDVGKKPPECNGRLFPSFSRQEANYTRCFTFKGKCPNLRINKSKHKHPTTVGPVFIRVRDCV